MAERIEYDVLLVGAGVANLALAHRLVEITEKPLKIALLEKAKETGGHLLSGAVTNPRVIEKLPAMVPFETDTTRQGKIIPMTVKFEDSDFRVKVLETVREVSDSIDLVKARVIVSGGYGVGCPEGYETVRDLASVFSESAVGASRKAVDSGWIPYSHQVGQTGKTVRPKLYIALGISGAIQHRVGISNSEAIIAVNKDESAPIFQFANYGIVGDLFEIAPLLKQRFKEVMSKGMVNG